MTVEAEEGGIAAEIARCLATMTALRVPTVSVLLGEGSGGGALALLPADRVIAVEHAWLSPIAPEGASAILYRTTDRADEVAAAQAISSTALRRLGIVDTVLAEPAGERGGVRGSAPGERDTFIQRVAAALALALHDLCAQHPAERRRARHSRYRNLGL